MSVTVLQLADDAGQRVDRVGRHAAVHARMQVDGGAAGVELYIKETAQGGREGGVAVFIQAAVPDQHRIRLES